MISNSFYDQFGKEIAEEETTYKAYGEKRNLESKKCNHSKAKVVNNELRCPCGAAWSGPRLQDLLDKLGGKNE